MFIPLLLTCGSSHWVLANPREPVVWEEIVFEDDFAQPDGSLPDSGRWVIGHPEDPDGWWVQGRTFFPDPAQHPAAPLPHVVGGALIIEHYHYNPFHLIPPNTTFLGGEIHTLLEFDPGRCYRFEARVRWPQCPRGLVSSFFTYGYDAEHADSDEIDFEFLSNDVFEPPQHQVWTNTWNESQQKPVQVPVPELDLTEWQTFRFYWYPDPRVEWTWVDSLGAERLMRTEDDVAYLPDEPLSLYFNLWAADPDWVEAYDADLQPDQQERGMRCEYWIDYVQIRVDGVARTWYLDAEGDGYGDANQATQAVQQPLGYVANDDDCDDKCSSCHPGAVEVCDGEDNDCDRHIDEGRVCDHDQSGQSQPLGAICPVVAAALLTITFVALVRSHSSRGQ